MRIRSPQQICFKIQPMHGRGKTHLNQLQTRHAFQKRAAARIRMRGNMGGRRILARLQTRQNLFGGKHSAVQRGIDEGASFKNGKCAGTIQEGLRELGNPKIRA